MRLSKKISIVILLILALLAKKMTSFSLVTQNELFQPDFSWTIDQISTLLQRAKFKVEAKSLKATPTGNQETDGAAGLSVDANEKVRVWLSLKKVGPFQPQIFFLIRDRSGAREPHHVCASMHTSYVHKLIGLGGVENKSHAHKSCLVHPAYNVDDSIQVDFYVEPSAMAHYVHSYDGTLNWAIDNFRRRKQMEIRGLIGGQESPYLYTSPKGYRVQLKFILQGTSGFINRPGAATRFWPRGAKFANPPLLQGAEENRGKGPSVEVRLLRGKWDQELDKSFPHHMTLTLLNRNHPSANVVRNIEWNRGISKRKRRYVVHLCSEGQMDSLVEEDTLYYEVVFREKSKNTNYVGMYVYTG